MESGKSAGIFLKWVLGAMSGTDNCPLLFHDELYPVAFL